MHFHAVILTILLHTSLTHLQQQHSGHDVDTTERNVILLMSSVFIPLTAAAEIEQEQEQDLAYKSMSTAREVFVDGPTCRPPVMLGRHAGVVSRVLPDQH